MYRLNSFSLLPQASGVDDKGCLSRADEGGIEHWTDEQVAVMTCRYTSDSPPLSIGMTMSGQEEGAAATASSMCFAPAPVSTRLMSGSVLVRDYRENWVGDESDVLLPGHAHAFSDVDMTAWVVAFLNAVDALSAPDMAAQIATLDPNRAASLAGHRQQLANVIAGTLIPVLVVPGEVPAIEPARAAFRDSLLKCLGGAYVSAAGDGGPLPAFPPPPVISDVRAVTAQSPASIAEALLWDCVATVAAPQAVQDELLLALLVNGPSAPAVDRTTETPAATLFGALARMTFEYPQIAPHLVELQAGGDAKVARAALERLDALIGDVVLTWPSWFARALPHAPDAGPVRGWSYRIDFNQRPALRVTRFPIDDMLPPWPEIAGFIMPPDDGQATDCFHPTATTVAGAPLTFTWAGLPILQAQQADVAASVTRNDNLVPPGSPQGSVVDPAFIYRTALAHGAAPASPFADLPSQPFRIGADAATLSEALDEVFTPLLTTGSLAGLAIRDIEIAIEASYRLSLGTDDAAIDSGSPIFLTHATLALSPSASDVSVPPAAFRQSLIDALIAWYAAERPDDIRAAIRFAITLSAAGAEGPSPLVRLGQVEIGIPNARAEWWR
jgi:hypothetical protein